MQGLKSQAVLKFRSLIGMVLFLYRVDISMHGVGGVLKVEGGRRCQYYFGIMPDVSMHGISDGMEVGGRR